MTRPIVRWVAVSSATWSIVLAFAIAIPQLKASNTLPRKLFEFAYGNIPSDYVDCLSVPVLSKGVLWGLFGDSHGEDEVVLRQELMHLPQIAILQLIYQQKSYEGQAKDYEFSGTSMREHWQSGHEDTTRTLKHRKWITMPPEGEGIVVHDVHREDGL